MRKKITVTRKLKDGKIIIYKMKDRGAIGKGKKILPEVRKPGAMTTIARQMGYPKPTDIPNKSISKYCDNLINIFGKKSVQGMLQKQITLRKNMTNKSSIANKKKFQQMLEYVLKRSE